MDFTQARRTQNFMNIPITLIIIKLHAPTKVILEFYK